MIKSQLENECPGIVSCADILVLAARESAVLVNLSLSFSHTLPSLKLIGNLLIMFWWSQADGPFYPLHTGRRDCTVSYPDLATYELPSPQDDLSRTTSLFASRGFDERETVSLLGILPEFKSRVFSTMDRLTFDLSRKELPWGMGTKQVATTIMGKQQLLWNKCPATGKQQQWKQRFA